MVERKKEFEEKENRNRNAKDINEKKFKLNRKGGWLEDWTLASDKFLEDLAQQQDQPQEREDIKK